MLMGRDIPISGTIYREFWTWSQPKKKAPHLLLPWPVWYTDHLGPTTEAERTRKEGVPATGEGSACLIYSIPSWRSEWGGGWWGEERGCPGWAGVSSPSRVGWRGVWWSHREVGVSLSDEPYYWADNLLMRKPYHLQGKALVISPAIHRSQLLRMAHNTPIAGHFGRERTIQAILERMDLPTIAKDVKELCASCPTRQKAKPANITKDPLHPLPIRQGIT